MTIRTSALLLLTALAIGCKSETKQATSIDLGFRFPSGETYVYATDSRQTIVQDVNGTNTEISQHMQLETVYKVQDEGSDKKLNINYEHFYIQSQNNGEVVEYDNKDTSKQPAVMVAAGDMVNHPFSIVVDQKGSIISVEQNADETLGTMTSPHTAIAASGK